MKQILITLLILSLCGCNGNRIGFAEREDLFTLEIGHLEDQLALYNLEGSRGIRRTGFTMRDGLFYISDGNSGKIVRFNSYGDLLFMIYNDERNPPPISLVTNIAEDEQATRWAYSFPLEEPGWITVDSRKHIFVEDRLPPNARRIDPEGNVSLDGIILHFDQDGKFINYLGQNGLGGYPFPRIDGLATSERDEIIVICRLPDRWDVFWFNSSGMLLYLVKITSATIPVHPDLPQALAVVDRIAASPDSRHLYIKVDYSRDTFDQSTNIRTGLEPMSSIIWTLSVEDGMYTSSVEIPLYEIQDSNSSDTSRGRSLNMRVFYSLLGITRGGKALLYFPVETGYTLLLTDTKSHDQRRGKINFSYDELRYNDFYLSPEGILTAMLADNYNIKVVWWRTDKFMGE